MLCLRVGLVIGLKPGSNSIREAAWSEMSMVTPNETLLSSMQANAVMPYNWLFSNLTTEHPKFGSNIAQLKNLFSGCEISSAKGV